MISILHQTREESVSLSSPPSTQSSAILAEHTPPSPTLTPVIVQDTYVDVPTQIDTSPKMHVYPTGDTWCEYAPVTAPDVGSMATSATGMSAIIDIPTPMTPIAVSQQDMPTDINTYHHDDYHVATPDTDYSYRGWKNHITPHAPLILDQGTDSSQQTHCTPPRAASAQFSPNTLPSMPPADLATWGLDVRYLYLICDI